MSLLASRLLMAAAAILVPGSQAAKGPKHAADAIAGMVNIQLHVDFAPAAEHKPVPFEIVHGNLLFKARIDGKDVWAVLDNGSSTTLLDTGFLRSHGLKIGKQLGDIRTPTGTLQRWRAPDVSIVVPGEMTVRGAVFATDLSPLSKLIGRPLSLIVGKELFDNLVFLIRPAEHNFELGPSGSYNPSADAQELILTNDRPQLNALIDGRPLVLTIDLGDGDLVSVGKKTWTRLGLDDAAAIDGRSANVNASMFSTKNVVAGRVRLGPIVARNVRITLSPLVAQDGDGRLGLGFLSQFTFAMDIKMRRLWLAPAVVTAGRR